MANKKSRRIQYLLEILKTRGERGASFEEIKNYVKRRFKPEDEFQEYSERSFLRDKKDLYDEREITINYNRADNVYTINWETVDEYQLQLMEHDWLMEALRQSTYNRQFIHFEKRPARGLNHLHGLIYAIENHLRLRFSYHKFRENTHTPHTVQPYALKEFDYHWYLLARDVVNNTEETAIRVFAVDRISDLDILKKKFTPTPFDVEKHFKNAFGVIALPDAPEDIVLRFDRHQGNYIKVRPLHHSQQIVSDNDDALVVRLHLTPSYDFDLKLLSLGNRVQVLEPQWYREHIVMRIKQALERYELYTLPK